MAWCALKGATSSSLSLRSSGFARRTLDSALCSGSTNARREDTPPRGFRHCYRTLPPAIDRRDVQRLRQDRSAAIAVRRRNRRVRRALGEHDIWQDRLVAQRCGAARGDSRPRRTISHSPMTSLPLTSKASSRSASIRSFEVTPARCWPATSTRARGRSTRSRTSMRATRNGVPAALERSRSGNGGTRLGVLRRAGAPRPTARAMGAALLGEAMAARAELDLSSYDRFFPPRTSCRKRGSAT